MGGVLLRRLTRVRLAGAFAALLVPAALLPSPAGAGGDTSNPVATAAQARSAYERTPRIVRELPSRRTAESKTYVTEDGNRLTRIAPDPIHYRGAKGDFLAIDNQFVRSPDARYAFRNRANAYAADLPASLQDPVGFAHRDRWVRFALDGARADARGTARGDQVTYEDALPGVDVRYQARAEGLKEELVLGSPKAPTSFSYRVDQSRGLTVERNAAGGIDFRDRKGTLVFAFQTPFMYDASGTERGISSAVDLTLRREARGLVVGLEADEAWVSDPARRFPITIDPYIVYNSVGVRVGQPSADTYASQHTEDLSHRDLDYLKAGLGADPDGGAPPHDHNAFLEFDVENAVPHDSTVLNATLGLYDESAVNANASTLRVHRATRGWTDSLTWNRYDGVNPWTAPGGDFAATGTPTCVAPKPGTWAYFNELRDMTQGWVDRTLPNHGMVVKRCSTSPENYHVFTSAEGSQSRWPFLEVIYHEGMGAMPQHTFLTPLRDGTEEVLSGQEPSDLQDVNINVANGNLVLRAQDGGTDVDSDDLLLNRFYNSWSRSRSSFGLGWVEGMGREIWLRPLPDGGLAFYGPTNYVIRFADQPNGTFVAPRSANASLVRNADGSYTVELLGLGTKYEFPAADYAMRAYVDPAGNRTTFAYKTSADEGAMSTATDGSGVTRYTNVPGNRRVTSITAPDGRVYRYAYNADEELVTHTAPNGAITRYEWDSTRALRAVVEPDGERTTFTYTGGWGDRRVATVTRVTAADGTGPTWRFAYTTGSTSVTSPSGQVTTYKYLRELAVRTTTTGATPPTFALSGTLVPRENLTLSDDVTYPLTVTAQDSNAGVKSIEIAVDGSQEAYQEQLCPDGACPMTLSYTLDPQDYAAGDAVAVITVTDQTGARATREMHFGIAGGAAGAPFEEFDVEPGASASTVPASTSQVAPAPIDAESPVVQSSPTRSAPAGSIEPLTTRADIFRGKNGPGRNGGEDQPIQDPEDPVGAVGPNDYVQFTNSLVSLYPRTGTPSFPDTPVTPVTLDSFIGMSAYDPYVVWDEHAQRFFFSAVTTVPTPTGEGGNHGLTFGWSKTNNPSNLSTSWCRLRVRFNRTGTPDFGSRYQEDYQKLGTSRHYIIIGSDRFDTGSTGRDRIPVGATVNVFPKPKKGDATCPTSTAGARDARARRPLKRFALKIPDGKQHARVPVPVTSISTKNRNGYIIAARRQRFLNEAYGGDAIYLWRVVKRKGKPALARNKQSARRITVPFYVGPGSVPQDGYNPLNIFETRMWQAVGLEDPRFENRFKIWTQHTIKSDDGADRSVVRWYELDPGRANHDQIGTIDSAKTANAPPDNNVFNGAISPTKNGGAVIHYNVARHDQPAEIHARARVSNDPLNTMYNSQTVVARGDAFWFVCQDPACKWGDYVNATPDTINPDVVWGTSMTVDASGRPRTQNFAIQAVDQP